MKEIKKVHIVIGTKAQLIKMGPIMHELEKQKIPYNFILTGQHQETMENLIKNFSIKQPDTILYQGKDITGIIQMLTWIVKISIKSFKIRKSLFGKTKENHLILTHGDTFSTLFGAILGKIHRVKVAHIESGLRSFNIFHPFPEELTRIITFHLSNYYFCPGEWAINNLKKFKGEKINTSLNTLLDSLEIVKNTPASNKLSIPREKYFICSCHRFENIFNKNQLKKILKIISSQSKNLKCLFILHPPTKKQLEKFNFIQELKANKQIELRPRYDYTDFIKLLNNAEFILTDGGSNQEECFYLGKPCLLLRKKTERMEGINQSTIISNFENQIIENFIDNYSKLKHSGISDKVKPSKIVVEKIKEIIK